MTQTTRPLFELTLGEVSLKAPETPLYLSLAAQVLEVRRQELQENVTDTPSSSSLSTGSSESSTLIPTTLPVPEQEIADPPKQPQLIVSDNPIAASGSRRGRWFIDQFPKIIFQDNSTQVISSLDGLKDLIRNKGLQPHPRGDASMLLWQVRNRLGLNVERVDVK